MNASSASRASAPARLLSWPTLDNPRALVFWTIVIGTAARLAAAAALGYGLGEGYYFATARHLALSYFDQPPLFLWITHATWALTGSDSAFVIRLPFIAMFVATTWLMYRLGALLFDERAGAIAAVLLNTSPVFTISAGGWIQPDGPLMLCLTAAAFCIARIAVAPPRHPTFRLWVAAGIWFGLALLSKYHAILIAGGLVLFALTSRAHRRWFAEPGPYVAALIALAIFSPVLLWNARNGWVSFDFQGSRAGGASFRPLGIVRSIGGQAGYLGPWVFVLLVAVYFKGLRRGPKATAIWLLCCLATIPLVLFTVIALWAEINAHFHWQSPGYLMLFPLVGVFIPEDARMRRWLIGSVAAMTTLLVIWLSQSVWGWIRIPVPPSLASYVEKFEDPTLEAFDWPELRAALAARGLLESPRLFVVATRWHQAGKMDVMVGDKLPVVCLCEDPRNIAFNWDERAFKGWDALIVGTDAFLPNVGVYAPYFDAIEKLDDIALHRAGSTVMTLHVYRGRNYNGRYPMSLPRR